MDGIRLAETGEHVAQAIERQEWLAPAEDRLQRAVSAAFRAGGTLGQRVKDFLHGTTAIGFINPFVDFIFAVKLKRPGRGRVWLAALDGLLAHHPGLWLTGNALRGVSLNDCVVNAFRIAREAVP